MSNKVRVSKLAGKWLVHCEVCSVGFFEFFPWATAATFDVARALADWHVKQHRATRCDCCGHTPPISKPVVGDATRGMFTIDDKPYAVTSTGVRRLVAS